MKNIISTLVILLTSAFGLSAQVNLDSLWGIWNDSSQSDTVRLQAMSNIAWDGYLFNKPDSAYYLSQLQYDFAKKKGLKKHMADALNAQGTSFSIRGDFLRAVDHYSGGLKLREEIGDNKGVASSLNNIGIVYKKQGNYSVAIDFYTRSLAILTQLEDNIIVARTLNNIGNIYREQEDYTNALEYYTQSLNIKKQIGDKHGVATSLNNIGGIYYVMGNYSNAHDYHTRSLELRKVLSDQHGIAECLNSIGLCYNAQSKHSQAIEYLTRSLKIREQIEDKQGIAECLNNLGSIYVNLGQYFIAVKNNKRALKIAQDIGIVVQIRDAAKALYQGYKSLRQPAKALEMHELYIVTQNRILNKENQRDVIRQEYKLEYEKQAIADSIRNVQANQVRQILLETEISKNERRQQQTYYLYGGIFILLLLLILLYKEYSVARHRKKIIERQKILVDNSNDKLIEKNTKIQTQADLINEINEEIRLANESLENKVKERTAKIELQNSKLREYSFSNSHEVRAPLARLMGLINLWNDKKLQNEDRNALIEKIAESALELDEIVKKVSVILDEVKSDTD